MKLRGILLLDCLEILPENKVKRDLFASLCLCFCVSIHPGIVKKIFLELPNLLWPNLVLWCIILNPSVMGKRFVCYFQDQSHTDSEGS